MSYWRRVSSLLVGLALVVLLAPTLFVTAQEQGASGLQIIPTKYEITVEPGEVKEVSFVVKNITNIDITAKVTLNDFESDENTGQPKIIVDTSKRNSYSLQGFIPGLESVDLKPGESKEVKVTIDVPAGTAGGGYYGALRFDATPKDGRSESERQVALTASVAPLLLVQVNGNITEQIQIQKVQALRNNKSARLFLTPPDKSSVTIKNLGNSFARPFGRVTVQNMRGKEVFAYEINNTDPRGNILPASTRIFTDGINGIKTPGRYHIIASITHGNGGEIINYKASFWYVPLWLLVVLIALVLGLIVGAYLFYKKKFGPNAKKKRR